MDSIKFRVALKMFLCPYKEEISETPLALKNFFQNNLPLPATLTWKRNESMDK